MKRSKKTDSCSHTPERLYSGFSKIPVKGKLIKIMWVGCCECGEILGQLPTNERRVKR